MSSKKYKTLRSAYIISNLNYIFKKSAFIGFFQLKSLDFENSVLIKQLIFGLKLQTFVCKNSFLKKNKLLSPPLFSPISQGPIIIVYSFFELLNFNIINTIIHKAKLVPLFFYFDNKFMFLKTLLLLSNMSKINLFIHLINLLNNHNSKISNLFITSNSKIQFLLQI